jgi:hypothetical protein
MMRVILEKLGLVSPKDPCDDEDKGTFKDAVWEAKVATAKATGQPIPVQRDQWRDLMVPKRASQER